MPFDCPGQYTCNGLPDTFANASAYLNALDRLWWHPCRLSDHNLINGCPNFGACVADGSSRRRGTGFAGPLAAPP